MAKPIAIRLSDEVLDRIDNVVETAHLGDRTAVIKLCLLSFLSHYEKRSSSALPLDWNDILQKMETSSAKKK